MAIYPFSDYLWFVAFQCVCLSALCTNLFVVRVIKTNRQLHTPTFLFLANQSLSLEVLQTPFCICDIALESNAYRGVCETIKVFWLAGIKVTPFFILLIAFDRFPKLYFPTLKYHILVTSIMVWMIVIGLSFLLCLNIKMTFYFGNDHLYDFLPFAPWLYQLQWFLDAAMVKRTSYSILLIFDCFTHLTTVMLYVRHSKDLSS